MTDASVLPHRSDVTSSSLLLRVKEQEPAAWKRLVHLYLPLVYSWCRRAHLREDAAQDVSQDVFLAVWGHIRAFRRDRPGDTFRGWLRIIVRHKICDHIRDIRGEPAGIGGQDDMMQTLPDNFPMVPEPDAEQDSNEASFLAHRAIALIRAEFSDEYWRAFEAVVMHDQDPTEVAEALHISRNKVYLAISRIKRRLREEFGDVLEI